MSVGKSVNRVDAELKVTGKAKYTDDFFHGEMLVAKVLHSKIAHGKVLQIDTEEAKKVEGVVKIVTCFDVPDITFPTAGHPWSTDKAHQDVADRKLLNTNVRYYGDDIAAVVATDEVAALKALSLIKVCYEEYEPLLSVEQAMQEGKPLIHEGYERNILAHSSFELGNFDEAVKQDGLVVVEGSFETQIVQHCHIEPPISYAYMENGRVVVVSSTQIPHIVRRVVGQALGIKWGKVRVIKPYIGGGFGNKQEVLYEPLNAFLSTQVGGRCVKLAISREETFVSTRTRHAIKFNLMTAVTKDGKFVARKMTAYSNQGGYASHGHSIVANATAAFRDCYYADATACEAYTVYTNLPSAGAMRGYGIPQVVFAVESHVDDIAKKLGIDPVELRLKNAIEEGYFDPLAPPIKSHTNGLRECIAKGKKFIGWDEKRASDNVEKQGEKLRGVGMALFTYKTGIHPISLEHACCRIVLNQDGSVQVQLGATEIGQGADTVFSQMASETLGIPIENVHLISTQDTDVTPFDTGAYASRQSYVSGMALRKTAELLKQKILDYAKVLTGYEPYLLDISNAELIVKQTQKPLISLEDLAMESFYNTENGRHITAEVSNLCETNTLSTGVCFAEVEVDVPLCKVNIVNIINVHDSGRLLNPKLAEAQVHGGMSMGLGYALSEAMLFDDKGKPLNNNLLDYKLPTSLDTPTLNADFVELYDPTGPYGNKSLGEPPTIPQAAAIRNAVLNATGVAFEKIPLSPQNVFEKLVAGGVLHV